MDFDFETTRRKKVLLLQLAPMIDVFVLIIVFLMKATVLSGVAITWPGDLKTARSKSTEGIETATQVVVTKEIVELKMLDKKIPLAAFSAPTEELAADGGKLQKYLHGLKAKEESGLYNVNLVADAGLQYQDLFPVISFLRSHGFNSILFIAEGESKQ